MRLAGAEALAVTSIAGHFCIDGFKTVSPLPIIDLLVEVDRVVAEHGYRRLGLIGMPARSQERPSSSCVAILA